MNKVGVMTNTTWKEVNKPIRVFVIGDGQLPFTAITLTIYFPFITNFISIDPIMKFDTNRLGDYSDRIKTFSVLSQEYIIEDMEGEEFTNIVIACHSHAPLQEFWDRVPLPKYHY